MNNLYIALLHHPVYNKKGDVVTTAVTNMDIHDISRTAKTYGVERFYIITPIKNQQIFVGRILHHWQKGYGITYNPSRKEAFDITDVKDTLESAVEDVSNRTKKRVRLIATSAASRKHPLKFEDIRQKILKNEDAYLLTFGTGWGIASEVIGQADFLLEPIKGPSDYNHLSVRSAVAISLDRLFGKK